MKLTELEPAWLGFYGGPAKCGVAFRCPCKARCPDRIHVMFSTSVDGVPAPRPSASELRWTREGKTFETLTLSPSIDATGSGHWHGWIRQGQCVSA